MNNQSLKVSQLVRATFLPVVLCSLLGTGLTLTAAERNVDVVVHKAAVLQRGKEVGMLRELLQTAQSPSRYTVLFSLLRSLDLEWAEVRPILEESLSHPSPNVRELSYNLLARYAPHAASLQSHAISAVRNRGEVPSVRIAALTVLGGLVPSQTQNEVVVEALRNAIDKGNDGGVREVALNTLVKLPGLLNAFEKEMEYLGREGSIAEKVAVVKMRACRVETLGDGIDLNLLTTPGTLMTEVQCRALIGLALMHPSQLGNGLLNVLLEVASDYPVEEVRIAAFESASKLIWRGPKALDLYLRSATSEQPLIRSSALAGLLKFNDNSSLCVRVLCDALRSPNLGVRYHSARVLAKYGSHGASAATPLLNALQEVDSQTSHLIVGAYLDALRRIGRVEEGTAQVLVNMLSESAPLYRNYGKNELHYLRAYTMLVLVDIGIPRSATPFVLDALANNNVGSHSYTAAARAAGALGSDAKLTIPFLIKGVKATEPLRSHSYSSYLAMFGQPEVLTNGQLEAVKALGKLGPIAGEALPSLKVLAQSGHTKPGILPDLQAQTLLAIKSIELESTP